MFPFSSVVYCFMYENKLALHQKCCKTLLLDSEITENGEIKNVFLSHDSHVNSTTSHPLQMIISLYVA